MNSLKPDLMTTKERLAELARILALGIVRCRQRNSRQSSQFVSANSENSLDCLADQSGHATLSKRRTA